MKLLHRQCQYTFPQLIAELKKEYPQIIGLPPREYIILTIDVCGESKEVVGKTLNEAMERARNLYGDFVVASCQTNKAWLKEILG